MAKLGYVEWLYVGELVGLLFIWAGYAPRPPPRGAAEAAACYSGAGAAGGP